MLPDSITIFTDGASRGNPGPGGFGAIIITPKHQESRITSYEVKEIGGRETYTTNNRMELTAAIKALEFVFALRVARLTLYADSSYLVNGITKWVSGWQKNNWKTKAKQDVENRDLWEKLADICGPLDIDWRLVAGHAGVAGNARCDEIATAFADGKTPALYSGILKNYGIKDVLNAAPAAGAAGKKDADRARSRAVAYSYVSMVGGNIMTHKTWAECEARVKGVKGARFKKALNLKEELLIKTSWKNKKSEQSHSSSFSF